MVVLSLCPNHGLDDEMGSVYGRCIVGASFLHLTIVQDCERRHAAHLERASETNPGSIFTLAPFLFAFVFCSTILLAYPFHRQKGHVTVLQYRALRTIHFPTISDPSCNGPVKALSSFGLPWMLLPYFVHFILVKEHFHSMNYATNPQPVNAISSPFFAQNGMD
jgi:hypothetical protein